MLNKRQSGFTLIEITIVLAITASLATIVLTSQGGVRGRAQFTGVVDGLVSRLQQTRNNAMTSYSTGGSGTSQSQIVFGELVQVTPGASNLIVADLIASNSGGQSLVSGGMINTLTVTNSRTIALDWGTTVQSITGANGTVNTGSQPYSVVFRRLLTSGKLVAYDVGTASPTAVSAYTESPTATLDPSMYAVGPIAIVVVDSGGRQATVTIDGLHDAAVGSVVAP